MEKYYTHLLTHNIQIKHINLCFLIILLVFVTIMFIVNRSNYKTKRK